MMLRIDAKDLENYLLRNKDQIGQRSIGESIANFIGGASFAVSGVLSNFPGLARGAMILLGVAFAAYSIWQGIRAVKSKQFSWETVNKDINDMDRTERRSSIIGVTDGTDSTANQYLLYHDEGWGCDFFPNRKTVDNIADDIKSLKSYFSKEFKIPEEDFDLVETVKVESPAVSNKKSTEHNDEERYYEYRLYHAKVRSMPDAWSSNSFVAGSKRCKWMTIDDMLADSRIKDVNSDVVQMVRDYD